VSGNASEEKTNVEKFCIVEYLAVFEVVPLGVTEALFEVVLDCDQGGVLTGVQLSLDLVERDGLLDDYVVVWVGALVGEAKKID
jgi:hypothetical protein